MRDNVTTEPKPTADTIRWLLRKDVPQVLSIESKSFEFPWTEEDFIAMLRQPKCLGMVAERNGKVVGYMLYRIAESEIIVHNFAVCPTQRRKGVGQQMINKLLRKLRCFSNDPNMHRRISVAVRESNLAAQLFFKACDFVATSVLHDFYTESGEDAYVMEHVLQAVAA